MRIFSKGLSFFAAVLAIVFIITYYFYLQFRFPVFYDPDSYYNAAVSDSIRTSGLHREYRWAQFSVLKTNFADRDLLLHIITVPFLYAAKDLVSAGKYASVFLVVIFLAVYYCMLRKYLAAFPAGLFILLPFSSPVFFIYSLQLRSSHLVNILTILGVYSLINKKAGWVFLISMAYAMAHVSFFMMVIFALVCEGLRYRFEREFFLKNLYASAAGCALGLLVHPDFPNNILAVYLNGLLVPAYSFLGIDLGFAGETAALGVRYATIGNFAVFISIGIALSAFVGARKKMGLASAVWLAASGVYLTLAFASTRFWYQANAIFFIFYASFVSDWMKGRSPSDVRPRVIGAIALYIVAAAVFLPLNTNGLSSYIKYFARRNAHYESVARWMNGRIPKGETIYHSYWDDSSYFLCLNPDDNYIDTNDPIYMFYSHPRLFRMREDLAMGRTGNPHEVLGKIFKTRYGYLRREEPLARQVREDQEHFRILFEDSGGMVFELAT